MSIRYTDNELDNSLFIEVLKTPLDETAIRNLIKNGANINAITNRGDTLIGRAVESRLVFKDLPIVNEGKSPLDEAVSNKIFVVST